MLAIATALGACQLLEYALREHLGAAKWAQKGKPATPGVTELTRKYRKWPLGRLIDVIEWIIPDEELLGRLRAIQQERNALAHNSIRNVLDPGGDFMEQEAKDAEKGYKHLQGQAIEAASELYVESAKYWFDNLDA